MKGKGRASTGGRKPVALVLGAGGWGTAFAILLHRKGFCSVLVPHRDPSRAGDIRKAGENRRYLPGIKIPRGLVLSESLEPWLERSSWLFLAVPMKGLKDTLASLGSKNLSGLAMISLVKGLDPLSLERPSQCVMAGLGLPAGRVAVLSGPSHAEEVGKGGTSAVVVASRNPDLARGLQNLLSGGTFRVYVSPDVAGVELAGALKNVIALAAGMADGLGLGDNAKAALVTRGLAELARLGVALGARPETFYGLAGMGDLVVTCYSPHGRNLRVGRALGRGLKLAGVLRDLGMVAEGVGAAGPGVRLAAKAGVDVPILRAVDSVIRGVWSPRQALKSLLGRSPGKE